MAQSRRDRSGHSHAHGWGLVTYVDDKPLLERQAWAAYHGEHFSRAASRTWSTTVLAHVRRATVGKPRIENTHPFAEGNLVFAHNGTVPSFTDIRPMLLAECTAAQRQAILGDTDSEHLFRHLLSLREEDPSLSLGDALRLVVDNVARWVSTLEGTQKVGLNIVLTDGHEIVGSRWGRPLYRVERRGVYDCEICGFPHIHHNPDRDHRAIVLASEPITHEDWQEIPEKTLWSIGPDAEFTSTVFL